MKALSALISTALIAMSVPSVHADGGALRFWERQKVYELAAFTLPTPVTVGSVDISVLVLEIVTGHAVPNAIVTLELSQPSDSGVRLSHRALSGTATNKLFYHASIELPRPGIWDVDVRVSGERGTAHGRFALSAVDAPPRSDPVWPWYSWPGVVIAVYVTHQWLIHRRSRTVGRRVG